MTVSWLKLCGRVLSWFQPRRNVSNRNRSLNLVHVLLQRVKAREKTETYFQETFDSDPDRFPCAPLSSSDVEDESCDFRHTSNHTLNRTTRRKVLRAIRKEGVKMIKRHISQQAATDILQNLMKHKDKFFDIDHLRQNQLPIVEGKKELFRACISESF